MAETNAILKQAKNVWENLGSGQKVAAGGVTVLVFAGILAAALMGGNPDYKQLVTNVAKKDIITIMTQLEDAGISDSDYKIVGENTIWVESSQFETARRTLYRNGSLPGVGSTDSSSSILPGSGGLSRDERMHTRLRETETRLERTIEGMGYVETAKVTITGKKQRYFRGGKENAKAMVIVKSRGVLGKDQIKTIAFVVANGVESLSPDAVAISNTMGMVLKNATESEEGGDQESRLVYKAQLEASKMQKAQEMLTAAYGENKVIVALDVNLDWTRSNITEKKFDAEGKVVREKLVTESSKPAGSSKNGGSPGNASLQGKGSGVKTATFKDSTKKESNDFGYKTSNVINIGGQITRMTASVIVDTSLEAQKQEVMQTVAGIIGIDESRGDQIEVSAIKMEARSEIPIDKETPAGESQFNYYLDKGLFVLLGLAFVFFALRTVKKAQKDLRNVLEASLEEDQKVDPVAPLTLEESVLETARGDADLAGRSLKRWLYEGAETAE